MQHALVITGDENVINFIIHDKASLPIRFTHHADIFKGLKQLTYKYFDILIFDIDLPGLDAVHALDIARNVQKGLHIIIITHDAHILHNKSLFNTLKLKVPVSPVILFNDTSQEIVRPIRLWYSLIKLVLLNSASKCIYLFLYCVE